MNHIQAPDWKSLTIKVQRRLWQRRFLWIAFIVNAGLFVRYIDKPSEFSGHSITTLGYAFLGVAPVFAAIVCHFLEKPKEVTVTQFRGHPPVIH